MASGAARMSCARWRSGRVAVLAGRAPLWGLAVDGEAGARDVLRILQGEILNALQLIGATSPADVGSDRVVRALP